MLKRENDNRIEEIFKLAKKVGCSGEVEKDRETQINSYEHLYDALRQNFKSSNSILVLKSKLKSCKQGATESVQNFTLRFRQIINEINYAVQA